MTIKYVQLRTARDVLTANRTYYVRTDGSNSNTGLVDSAGGAFLTIQKAVDIATALDNGGYAITLQVRSGTYAGAVILKSFIGSGTITLVGDTTTPANVVISTTSNNAIYSLSCGTWYLGGFKLVTTTSGHGLFIEGDSIIIINGKMDFGTMASGGIHILVNLQGVVRITTAYNITGGAFIHWGTFTQGNITCQSQTITLTGTPAFSYFSYADRLSIQDVPTLTFSGSATGQRYQVQINSAIYTNGGGANYLPGNSAGATASGGQYV